MSPWLQLLVLAGAVGSGLMGGLFFAFSNFVMRALGRQPAPQAIAVMQAINVTVLNPLFLLLFLGVGLVGLALAAVALLQWHLPAAPLLLAGGLCYPLGTLLVTIACNVPLNNALARVEPESAAGAQRWVSYQRRWTAWNHLRSVAALAGAALLTAALL